MDRIEVGRRGEEEAVRYLVSQGWTVLARNYRWGHREVDVVASRGRVLAFVEVKCRSGEGFGHPLQAITPAKQREIARVARSWLRESPPSFDTVLRFDAISVLYREEGRFEVLHVPDAWRLG